MWGNGWRGDWPGDWDGAGEPPSDGASLSVTGGSGTFSGSASSGAPVDVRVSWLAFDTAASPYDVRVSWLAFDTAATPYDVKVSWLEFDTAGKPATSATGGGQRNKLRRDPYAEEALEAQQRLFERNQRAIALILAIAESEGMLP